jgi:hypothetical protein
MEKFGVIALLVLVALCGCPEKKAEYLNPGWNYESINMIHDEGTLVYRLNSGWAIYDKTNEGRIVIIRRWGGPGPAPKE